MKIDFFSAVEVLRDATLTVSYTFNFSLIDDGPLGINGTGTNVQYDTNGRVNVSLSLSVSPSFVRITGLVYLGTSGHPYSIAVWIKPTSVNGGTIIHVSPSSGGTSWSFPMLGFTSSGNIAIRSCDSGGSKSLTGPVITVNVWTHVVITYSSTNKLRLWINGGQVAVSTSNFVWTTTNVPLMLTLGVSITSGGSCSTSPSIIQGQYFGLMDEFNLFSRELSSADITSLANP